MTAPLVAVPGLDGVAGPTAPARHPRRPEQVGYVRVGLGCLAVPLGFFLANSRPSVPLLSLGLLALTIILAVRTTTERSLAFAYAGVVAAFFVLAPMLKGPLPRRADTVWFLLALWFTGWSLGQLVMTRLAARRDARRAVSLRKSSDPLLAPAILVVGVLSLAVQLLLIRGGSVGYGAQVRGVVSTGPLAIFASVGPAALASAYVIARVRLGSAKRRAVMLGLLVAQSVALAATGFKGAGPVYLLTVWLVSKRWVPTPRWHPKRIARAMLAVTVMLVLFNFADGVRQRLSETSPGPTTSGWASLSATPALAVKRLDLLGPADTAIELSDLREARETVSATSQLVSFIPRVFWPDKPPGHYGQEVARVFFDIPVIYRTSSSITWIGDLFVQGGALLIVLVSVLVGLVYNRMLRWCSRPDPVSVACYFLAVQLVLTAEAPLLISFATSLRSALSLAVAVLGVRTLIRIARGRRTAVVSVAPPRPAPALA